MKKTILLCTTVTILAGFSACKKQVSEEAQVVVFPGIAADDAEADATFNDVADGVSGVNDDLGFTDTEFGDNILPVDPLRVKCYTVTITPTSAGVFPKTVTIDFGTGCVGRDGRTRKGKVITVFTGRLRVPGSSATTTFDGYYVNEVHVEGTHVIQNNSTADARIITRTVTNGKLSKTSGNYIQWNATHTRTQTVGMGTPNLYWDDEFEITGNASGTSSYSGTTRSWSRNITSALHKKAGCKWFDKGTIAFTINGKNATLDFGTGSCDNKATVSTNTFTKEITLP